MDRTRGGTAPPASGSPVGASHAQGFASLQPRHSENTNEASPNSHLDGMHSESLRPQSQSTTGSKRVAQELEDEIGSHRKKRRGRPRTVERDENDVPVYLQRKKKKSVKQVTEGPYVPADPKTSPPTLQEIINGQPCMVQYEHIRDFWANETHWTGLDEKILEQSTRNNTAEYILWQIMWQGFKTTVTDLFRFGLVINNTGANRTLQISDEMGGSTRYHYPYMTVRQSESLRELACHPVWQGRIDVFRYVLMWAVFCHIEDHDEPLEPIIPLESLTTKKSFSKVDLATIAYEATKQSSIRSEPVIDSLCRKLKNMVKPRPAESDVEKQLFMLGSADVANATDALDSLTHPFTNDRYWTTSTSDFYNRWKDVDVPKERIWPKEKDDVFRLKKAAVQRARMESAFRDLLPGTGSYLYDISGTNTYGTATCFDNIEADGQDGPTQSQLDVVRGLVMPPFGAQLPASQWRMNQVGSSTNTQTNPHTPISRSRASSAARGERRSFVDDEGNTLLGMSLLPRRELDPTNTDRQPLHQRDIREATHSSSPPAQPSANRDESVNSGHQQRPRVRRTAVTMSQFDQFLKSEDSSSA